MHWQCTQQIREQLERRLQRLRGVPAKIFHAALRQTLAFLQGNEIVNGILADLERRNPMALQAAKQTRIGALMAARNEAENAAICYVRIKDCARLIVPDIELEDGGYITDSRETPLRIEAFRVTFVEPLFGYIQEQIDDSRMMLALLKRYKYRCELFRRSDLLQEYKANTRQGERVLAYDLYEYLHEQGVDIHIEPKSASGRVDLISAQSGPDRLVADAKIFNPSRGQGRAYLIKGFRQVYEYTKDYNEPFGYLVIFKTCEQDLSIPTAHQESTVRLIMHNNKTIFLLIIDIFGYQAPASRRGKLEAYEITPEQLCATSSPGSKTRSVQSPRPPR
jgi:hypothetical protein